MPQISNSEKSFLNFPRILRGDWLVILGSLLFIVILFQTLWTSQPASKLRIRVEDKVYGTYSLDQSRSIVVKSNTGKSIIEIHNSRVRFVQSSCRNQYCVHQGWLQHAGQAAICLPNHISLELLGAQQPYDSLNY